MEANFWHERWESNDIGFHQAATNPLLVAHFDKLALARGSRLFLPLCGKTLDIAWLLSGGYRVAGAELSELAVTALFAELRLEPVVSAGERLTQYSAAGIDIFVGDIFDLDDARLGPVDAVYDRAALVALPPDLRRRYSAHLMAITLKAPQLLLCYEYDQRLMPGPPFSISGEEVMQHYGAYDTALIARKAVEGGLKGVCAASENVWLLKS